MCITRVFPLYYIVFLNIPLSYLYRITALRGEEVWHNTKNLKSLGGFSSFLGPKCFNKQLLSQSGSKYHRYVSGVVLHHQGVGVWAYVCVSDWFLFYGLASRVLVIPTNKSALLDLSANANKTLYYWEVTHKHAHIRTHARMHTLNAHKFTRRQKWTSSPFLTQESELMPHCNGNGNNAVQTAKVWS